LLHVQQNTSLDIYIYYIVCAKQAFCMFLLSVVVEFCSLSYDSCLGMFQSVDMHEGFWILESVWRNEQDDTLSLDEMSKRKTLCISAASIVVYCLGESTEAIDLDNH